jgi:tripartite-type tricarboxylate transporter receptor subunit TctC
MPADDLKGLIAWLKANPDKVAQGSGGVGGTDHIGGILAQKETGTRFGFLPYRGGAPALLDLVAGQIDMAILDPTTSLAHLRHGGKIALSAAGESRRCGNKVADGF